MDCLKNHGAVFSMATLLLVLAASLVKGDDTAYFQSGGQFGTIDLTTGAATFMGNIGSGGPVIRGIAIAQAAPVPEPVSLGLLLVGVLALFYRGWRPR